MTFPGDTGLGHDNIAPRAITRLSPDAIKTLAALFVAFERYGEWAEVNDLVLIVLLPKKRAEAIARSDCFLHRFGFGFVCG